MAYFHYFNKNFVNLKSANLLVPQTCRHYKNYFHCVYVFPKAPFALMLITANLVLHWTSFFPSSGKCGWKGDVGNGSVLPTVGCY